MDFGGKNVQILNKKLYNLEWIFGENDGFLYKKWYNFTGFVIF